MGVLSKSKVECGLQLWLVCESLKRSNGETMNISKWPPRILVILCLLIPWAVGAEQPAAGKPTIEVLHFWHSPGEQNSLKIIKDSIVKEGGAWHESIFSSMDEERREAVSRIASGFPPTSLQWHAGPELQLLADLDIIRDLSQIATEQQWHKLLSPIVLESVSINGQPFAVPTNIHGDNWAWYNAQIYRLLNLDYPQNWDEFLTQAQTIKDAGYWPLVVGTEPWHSRMLFNAVLIGIGGNKEYLQLEKGDAEAAKSKTVLDAFVMMSKLREYAIPFDSSKMIYSHDAARHVMDGKAAVLIMGDWIKSEFIIAGKEFQKDFHCDLAPGNASTMLVVVDAFVFPKSNNDEELVASNMLIDHMLRPEVQRKFSKRKGAIPARLDINMDGFDQCAQLAMKMLSSPESQLPAPPLIAKDVVFIAMDTIIDEFWNNKEMTPQKAVTALYRDLAAIKDMK